MKTCPSCGGNNIEVPMVDIGVGEIQCGPAFCPDCEWSQPYEPDGLGEEGLPW